MNVRSKRHWAAHDVRRIAVTAAVVLPLLWFAGSAIAAGWFPQGDEALIALRSHDVFSAHPPLLGMRTTSDASNPGVWAHHPGPAQFYLLSVPYALTGFAPIGLIVGGAVIAAAFVVIALGAGYRAGGWPGLWCAAAVAVALESVFGRVLVLPFNTWPPVLGLLATLMTGWQLLRDDVDALPWYAACASFTAQTHLGFLSVVGVLTGFLAVVGIVRWRRVHDVWWPMSGARPAYADRPRWRRPGTIATAITVALWLPPLLDLFLTRPNNLSELIALLGSPTSAPTVGFGHAFGYLLRMFLPTTILPSTAGTLAALLDPESAMKPPQAGLLPSLIGALTIAGVVVTAWGARGIVRRPRRRSMRRPSLALIALVCCLPVWWTASREVGEHRLAYIALLVAAPLVATAAVIWSLAHEAARKWPQLADRAAHPGVAGGLAVIAALLLVITLPGPSSLQTVGGSAQDWKQSHTVADPVVASVDRLAPGRAVIIQSEGPLSQFSVGPAVATALRSAGHPVFFDTSWPRQQEDDFRRVRHAPTDAIRVVLRERVSGGPWFNNATIPAGISWSHSFTVEFAGVTGEEQVAIAVP
ncbi:hypothetical protein [Calidifontibacter terrae]